MEVHVHLDGVKVALIGRSCPGLAQAGENFLSCCRGEGETRKAVGTETEAAQAVGVDGTRIAVVAAQRAGRTSTRLVDHSRYPDVATEGVLHRGRIFLSKVLGAKGLVGVQVSMR